MCFGIYIIQREDNKTHRKIEEDNGSDDSGDGNLTWMKINTPQVMDVDLWNGRIFERESESTDESYVVCMICIQK